MTPVLLFVILTVSHHSGLCSQYRPPGTKISAYENYLEDLSPIGKDISCTEAEKECYKFNRVLYSDGKCYMVSHTGPCELNFEMHFNKEKAQNGELVPECTPAFRCGDANLRFMSYDQTCYKASLVNEVCDYNKNLTYSQDIYGGGHCRCFGDHCPSRPDVKQPEEQGRCRLPDLIWTSFPYWNDPLMYRNFPCSAQEFECFKDGKMLHTDGSCYRLLERGPCQSVELFAADKKKFSDYGWVVSTCIPVSCVENAAEKFVRFQNDGKCYKLNDLLTKLCPPHRTVLDIFGEGSCGFDDQANISNHLKKIVRHNDTCRLNSYVRF